MYYYFFSYDARIHGFEHGVRRPDESVLGDRSFFRTKSIPPALVLDKSRFKDSDTYSCKVDYTFSPTTQHRLNLTVIGKSKQSFIILRMDLFFIKTVFIHS